MPSNRLYGVGINDADYIVSPTVNGKQVICVYYQTWRSMLARACSAKEKSRHKTYEDVTVCKEWTIFSKFKSWMLCQDFHGKQLDKDLLIPGNKIYSPETCCFVDSATNKILLRCAERKGPYPVGVSINRKTNRIFAQCKDHKGKQKRIGTFDSLEEAHKAYLLYKINLIRRVALTQNDPRISKGLYAHIEFINQGGLSSANSS